MFPTQHGRSLLILLALGCSDADKETTTPSGTTSTDDQPVDADGDSWTSDEDCDDSDASVSPGAVEVCDGIDNNCDGVVDPPDASGSQTFYTDADDDGFGDAAYPVQACSVPEGAVANLADCDDTDPSVNPDALEVCDGFDNDCDGRTDDDDTDLDEDSAVYWFPDEDDDGYGDADRMDFACEPPSDSVSNGEDCDDTNAAVQPDAQEVCDDIDNDCDGLIDDNDDSNDPTSAREFYADEDGDGFGAGEVAFVECRSSGPFAPNNDDCNDTDPLISPLATEVCDDADFDEDCNGLADNNDPAFDPATGSTWYPDADGDSYGDPTHPELACDPPDSTYVTNATDCDDTNAGVHPAATEVCDDADTDEDCDGLSDDDDPGLDSSTRFAWIPDADADDFGDPTATPVMACNDPSSSTDHYVTNTDDCNDADASIHPDATEVCDSADVDEDCNGVADDFDPGVDNTTMTAYYPDSDGDGYGEELGAAEYFCDLPSSGYSASDDDCNDDEASVNPGASEVCSLFDDDCDTSTLQTGMVYWTDSAGVGTDLTSAWSTGSVVDWSSPDDGTLAICEGTWLVHLTIDKDTVSIIGPDGQESTILDGDGSGTVLSITGGAVVELSKLTIENGEETNGGGIYTKDSTLFASEFTLQANTGTSKGGGIYADSSGLSLSDCSISGNFSDDGGGMYVAGIGPTFGQAVSDCLIDSNSATGDGGGVYTTDGTTDLYMDRTTISNNTASGKGGGVYIANGLVFLEGTDLTDNVANDDGGGLYSKDEVVLIDVDMTGNHAGDKGGAAFYNLDATSNTVDYSSSDSSARCEVDGNTAGTSSSAGWYLDLKNTIAGTNVVSISAVDFGSNGSYIKAASSGSLSFGTSTTVDCNYSNGCR